MSKLARFIADQGPRGYYQFRMIHIIKGVEFGTRVYTFKELLSVIRTRDLEFIDVHKLFARKADAGSADWEEF